MKGKGEERKAGRANVHCATSRTGFVYRQERQLATILEMGVPSYDDKFTYTELEVEVVEMISSWWSQ